MTDKELLEQAAKAAGLTIAYWQHGEPYIEGKHPILWNPLEYDSNALRLAVQLGFCVSVFHGHMEVLVTSEKGSIFTPIDDIFNYDPYAATRYAIVSAAAQLAQETVPLSGDGDSA